MNAFRALSLELYLWRQKLQPNIISTSNTANDALTFNCHCQPGPMPFFWGQWRGRVDCPSSRQTPNPGRNGFLVHSHMSRCRQNSIAAKWNIFLSFGLKVPFGFPCFAHVCLESWLRLVFFSTAYVTLVVALLFGGLVLLLAFLQRFFNRFLSLRCSTVTLLEVRALASFYEWMDSVSDFATYA